MIGIIDSIKLNETLKKRGIRSILELSRLSGIHRNTLAPYLNGEKSIYSNAILDLASFLETDPEQLREQDSTKVDNFIIILAENFHKTFSQNYPDLAVLLFGSRARGKARKFSDYDLGVTSTCKPIGSRDFLAMKEFICQQADNFAWKVDLVNLDQAPTWFLSDLGVKPTKLLSGSSDSYNFLKGRAYECYKTKSSIE